MAELREAIAADALRRLRRRGSRRTARRVVESSSCYASLIRAAARAGRPLRDPARRRADAAVRGATPNVLHRRTLRVDHPRLRASRRRPRRGGDLMAFLPMVAIFVVFYFLLIRPQQKKAKETKAMLEALQKGDEVVTAGGIVGKIAKLDRPVRDGRNRAERRDHRAARARRAAAAQGHDQGAVTPRGPIARPRASRSRARTDRA